MLEGLLKGLELYEQAHIKIIIAIMYARCWIFKIILPFSVRFLLYVKKCLRILVFFIASQNFWVQVIFCGTENIGGLPEEFLRSSWRFSYFEIQW